MKIFALILTLIIIFSFSGCRGKNPFRNYEIAYSTLTTSEVSKIEELQSELTYTPDADIFGDITLVHFTEDVKRGNSAEISLKGKPDSEYSIKVTYSSGVSKSKSLTPQVSDKNGYVGWKWTVGASTKTGSYPVEILENDTTVLKVTLNVK